jgi:hypothetical protein
VRFIVYTFDIPVLDDSSQYAAVYDLYVIEHVL